MSVQSEGAADPLDATAIAPSRSYEPSELGEHTMGETFADAQDEADDERVEVERGALIGRYIVADTLGTGAMGIVLAAYDPELDRKVALKLLKYQGEDPQLARARLQREAQALAKLDHPNVVTVYDVGTHGDRLFVAMEFVAGRDFQTWMSAGARPWREALGVFAAAGRGLAAAHGAGLLHRDVKPANLMLGDDGRVRVMDFGLARSSASFAAPEAPNGPGLEQSFEALRSVTGNALSTSMTREGALIGTPAYMAPEQLMGRAASEKSDQFGFCVALYRALYGERPFAGETLRELLDAIIEGELQPAPRGTSVPAWVRDILQRGLAADPKQRWPSMQALLDALADDPALRRRKRLAVFGVVALISAGSWAAASNSSPTAAAPVCTGFETALDELWNPARSELLHENFVRTGLSYAEDTAARVQQRVEAYTAGWVEARTQACLATERGEQSGELLDLRMACLDARRAHLEATLALLADADSPPVAEAIEAVTGLPRLERCADVSALRARQAPPEDTEVAARVESLDAELIEIAALADAGQFATGLERAEALLTEVETLDYGPLEVRARLRYALLQEDSGDYAGAAQTLEAVYTQSVALHMDEEAADATALLMHVSSTGLGDADTALSWAKHAEPWARAVGDPLTQAAYLNTRGALALQRSNYTIAETHHREALEIYERELEPGHPDIARCLSNLATAAFRQGQPARARAAYERALSALESSLGPRHPHVATVLANLGTAVLAEGELARAEELLARALAINEEALGPMHPGLATALLNLGAVTYKQRRFADTRAHFERAREIFAAALGPEHIAVAIVTGNIAGVSLRQGQFEQARENSARALAMLEATMAPDAVEIAAPLVNLGQALLGLERPDEALPYLERAMKIAQGSATGSDLAEYQFALARALTRERDRALELARAAETSYAAEPDAFSDELAELRAWIAQR